MQNSCMFETATAGQLRSDYSPFQPTLDVCNVLINPHRSRFSWRIRLRRQAEIRDFRVWIEIEARYIVKECLNNILAQVPKAKINKSHLKEQLYIRREINSNWEKIIRLGIKLEISQHFLILNLIITIIISIAIY